MHDDAQLAVEPADAGQVTEYPTDGSGLSSLVERPDGRVYIGPQGYNRSATVADLAWGRALRDLQAGRALPIADIDRALASLVIARTEPGEVPAMAARRLVATGDVVFGTLYAGRRQAGKGGRNPL